MRIETVADVLVWGIFSMAWLFVALHTILSWVEWRRYGRLPWWRTIVGWLVTSAVGSLGMSFAFIAAAMVHPQLAAYPWYLWAYVLSFGGVLAVLVAQNVARIVLHVKARRQG
jgi:hypothetical protein